MVRNPLRKPAPAPKSQKMLGIRHPAGFRHFQIHLARQLHLIHVFTKTSIVLPTCRRQAMRYLFVAVPEATALFRSLRMKLSARRAGAQEIEESPCH
jgi:hypothetical protein